MELRQTHQLQHLINHNIRLEGITLETTVPNKALVLNNCKDSKFKDVKFKGPWVSGAAVATTDVAVEMNSLSGTVETKNNIFEECTMLRVFICSNK